MSAWAAACRRRFMRAAPIMASSPTNAGKNVFAAGVAPTISVAAAGGADRCVLLAEVYEGLPKYDVSVLHFSPPSCYSPPLRGGVLQEIQRDRRCGKRRFLLQVRALLSERLGALWVVATGTFTVDIKSIDI